MNGREERAAPSSQQSANKLVMLPVSSLCSFMQLTLAPDSGCARANATRKRRGVGAANIGRFWRSRAPMERHGGGRKNNRPRIGSEDFARARGPFALAVGAARCLVASPSITRPNDRRQRASAKSRRLLAAAPIERREPATFKMIGPRRRGPPMKLNEWAHWARSLQLNCLGSGDDGASLWRRLVGHRRRPASRLVLVFK